MRERLITLSTAIAALALLIFLLAPQHRSQQHALSLPTSEDSGPDGLKGLFTWLQRENIGLISLRKPFDKYFPGPALPADGNVLIMSTPASRAVSEPEWLALKSWLRDGNTVIILSSAYLQPAWAKAEDCYCDVKHFLALFDWTLNSASEREQAAQKTKNPSPPLKKPAKSLKETLDEMPNAIKNQIPLHKRFVSTSQFSILSGVTSLESLISPEKLKQNWTLASAGPNNLAERLLQIEGSETVAAWRMTAGFGSILLMLTPDVFNNTQLNQADNARLLSNMLELTLAPDGRVIFDDYHFGLSELYDPEHFYADPRLHQTLACLGLFWLFYLIGYTTRLAPVRQTALKLSNFDFIEVMTEFYARRLNQKTVAAALVKHYLSELRRQRHLNDETAAWQWLARHSRISQNQLDLLKMAENRQKIPLRLLANTITHLRTLTL